MKITLKEKEKKTDKKSKVKDRNKQTVTTGCYENGEKACDDCKRNDCPEEEA